MSSLYAHLFPRFRPTRERRPQGSGSGWALRIRWLGTAGYVIESRTTTVLVDPFVSRQSFANLLRPLVPDVRAIETHVPSRVDAVLCGHSHYDHVADAPLIAKLRGSLLAGSRSTCMWGRAAGIDEDKLVEIAPEGRSFRVGDIDVTFVPSRHGRVAFGAIPLKGETREPPRQSRPFWHYRMGGAFGILLRAEGTSVYHVGSADLVDTELTGIHADVLLACLARRAYSRNYVARLLDALTPSLVVPSHHDAFFAPMSEGVHLLPGIDLEGFADEVVRKDPRIAVLTPLYEEPICVPEGDARGSVVAV